MNTFLLALYIIMAILGVIAERIRLRKFREGKIKGIPQSKNFFDWMFYNYHE